MWDQLYKKEHTSDSQAIKTRLISYHKYEFKLLVRTAWLVIYFYTLYYINTAIKTKYRPWEKLSFTTDKNNEHKDLVELYSFHIIYWLEKAPTLQSIKSNTRNSQPLVETVQVVQ